MKERFKLVISGYIDEDGDTIEPVIKAVHDTEEEALEVLSNKSEDDKEWFYIQREIYVQVKGNIYQWNGDENYSKLGDHKYFYQFN